MLEHLLRTGAAGLVDAIAVEWHTEKRGQGGARAQLLKRQAKIEAGLKQAGVRMQPWKA